PIFKGITQSGNPALAAAQASAPVQVFADPDTCSLQFNPVGTAQFTSSCDIIKSFLARNSVNYSNEDAPPGTVASVKVGDTVIESFEGGALAKAEFNTRAAAFDAALTTVIRAAGYPAKADPDAINWPMLLLLLVVLGVFSA